MKVLREPPPNYDELTKVFPIKGRPVLFAWGPDTIYASFGAILTPSKMVHESIHLQRMGDQPWDWWRRYVDDKDFRLTEEIPAHFAEYDFLCRNAGRRERRAALGRVSSELASSLYGNMVSRELAKRILLVGPPATPLQAQIYRSTAAAYDAAQAEKTT